MPGLKHEPVLSFSFFWKILFTLMVRKDAKKMKKMRSIMTRTRGDRRVKGRETQLEIQQFVTLQRQLLKTMHSKPSIHKKNEVFVSSLNGKSRFSPVKSKRELGVVVRSADKTRRLGPSQRPLLCGVSRVSALKSRLDDKTIGEGGGEAA